MDNRSIQPTIRKIPDEALKKLIAKDPDINEDRKNAVGLIKKYNKNFIIATKDDQIWFKEDIEVKLDKELEEEAKDIVSKNWEKMSDSYPFDISEWIVNWYRFMPEAFISKKSGAGQVDWNLFFSIISPIHYYGIYCFQTMIHKLNIKQNKEVRQLIYRDCFNNQELRQKLINNEPIPSIYTNYTPYTKIRREVLKMVQKLDKDPTKEKVFTLAVKYLGQGLSPQEAMKKAETELENTKD